MWQKRIGLLVCILLSEFMSICFGCVASFLNLNKARMFPITSKHKSIVQNVYSLQSFEVKSIWSSDLLFQEDNSVKETNIKETLMMRQTGEQSMSACILTNCKKRDYVFQFQIMTGKYHQVSSSKSISSLPYIR